MTIASPLDSARVVLAEAERQIATIRAVYEQSLQDVRLPDRVPAVVKNALENQRSPLDYLAYQVVQAFGTVGREDEVYYPWAESAQKFGSKAQKKLPGVQRVDLLALFERHQPYQPGHEWMWYLSKRVNPIKHRDLIPHMRTQTAGPVVVAGGSPAGWAPRRFALGQLTVNSWERRPTMPTRAVMTRNVCVDWIFEGTDLSVLGTLETVQQRVEGVLDDFGRLLGW